VPTTERKRWYLLPLSARCDGLTHFDQSGCSVAEGSATREDKTRSGAELWRYDRTIPAFDHRTCSRNGAFRRSSPSVSRSAEEVGRQLISRRSFYARRDRFNQSGTEAPEHQTVLAKWANGRQRITSVGARGKFMSTRVCCTRRGLSARACQKRGTPKTASGQNRSPGPACVRAFIESTPLAQPEGAPHARSPDGHR
jgi:hypothetical protein